MHSKKLTIGSKWKDLKSNYVTGRFDNSGRDQTAALKVTSSPISYNLKGFYL